MASLHSDMKIYVIYFAICWNGLVLIDTLKGKNSISYTLSAGNLSLNLFISKIQSASETTRETSFNFSDFRLYFKTFLGKDPELTNEWLTWFIGFVEGDGALQSYDKGKRVRFVLTQKERAILYYIQKKIGIGIVKHFPQGTSGNKNDFYRLIVDNPLEILMLAHLFNGHLTINNRVQQLSLWIQVLNNRFGTNTIKFKNTLILPTLDDGWLSGFTDAEGCFNVSITSNSRYALGHVIKLRYLLDQKDKIILDKLQDLLGFGKVTLRSKTDYVYRYTATGFKSMNYIIAYFKAFPLKTKKAQSFEKWLTIHKIITSKLHLSKEGLAQIRIMQKEINVNKSTTNKTGSAHP